MDFNKLKMNADEAEVVFGKNTADKTKASLMKSLKALEQSMAGEQKRYTYYVYDGSSVKWTWRSGADLLWQGVSKVSNEEEAKSIISEFIKEMRLGKNGSNAALYEECYRKADKLRKDRGMKIMKGKK